MLTFPVQFHDHITSACNPVIILVARLPAIVSGCNHCIYIVSVCKPLVILVARLYTIVSGQNSCIYIVSGCKPPVIPVSQVQVDGKEL